MSERHGIMNDWTNLKEFNWGMPQLGADGGRACAFGLADIGIDSSDCLIKFELIAHFSKVERFGRRENDSVVGEVPIMRVVECVVNEVADKSLYAPRWRAIGRESFR